MRDHSQQDEDTEINMTPMLDIVFIMLIFFIVTAVFVKDAGVDVNKIGAQTTVNKKSVSIIVAVTSRDTIHIDGKEVALEQVKPIIERLYAENPKGTIAIKIDEEAKSGIAIDVYEKIQDAGVQKVAISTVKE